MSFHCIANPNGNQYIVKMYSLVAFCTWTYSLIFEMIYWRNLSYDNMKRQQLKNTKYSLSSSAIDVLSLKV